MNFITRMKLKQFSILTVILVACLYFLVRGYFGCKEGAENEYPVLVWWTPFHPEKVRIIECAKKLRCIATTTRNFSEPEKVSGYLFYGSNFESTDLPLPRNSRPWAILHEESPKNFPIFIDERGQKLFNITSTFSRYSDLPLTQQYLKSLESLTDLNYFIPTNMKNERLDKLAPVLYLQSSCDTPIDRDKYVQELMKYVKIDSYGVCLNNKEIPEELIRPSAFNVYNEKEMKFLSQYKFTIAIENAGCEDYITEKLWRPLIVGSVPIYLGSPSIQDWLPNNKSAILIKDFKNMEQLGQFINNLNNNDTLYEEYLTHKIGPDPKITNQFLLVNYKKRSHDFFGETLESLECSLCEAVHLKKIIPEKQQSVHDCPSPNSENSWVTHWRLGRCQAKVLHELVSRNVKNFTSKEYERLYFQYFEKNNCD